MKRHLLVGLSVAALAANSALLGGASPAHAADSRFGNDCLASVAPEDVTFVIATADPGNTVPGAASSAGVVTSLQFNVPGGAPTFPTNVKIMRPAGGDDFTTVRETAPLSVTSGLTSYPTRVRVAAGDTIGLFGSSGSLACSSAPGDVIGQFMGDTAVGSTETFSTSAGASVPVVATVEPDVDGDGFGDTTQDLCPQSAAIQTECPVIRLDGFAVAQKNKTLALVSANEDARVKVRGTVKVKGKKYTLKKTRNVKDGRLGKFKLNYPKKMRTQLRKAPASKSYKLTLVATTKDVVGRTIKKKFSVKIPGTK